MKILDQAFEATRTVEPLSDEQVEATLETSKHPDFMGGASPSVEKLVPGPTR